MKRRTGRWTGKTRVADDPVCAAYGRKHTGNGYSPFAIQSLDWVAQKCC